MDEGAEGLIGFMKEEWPMALLSVSIIALVAIFFYTQFYSDPLADEAAYIPHPVLQPKPISKPSSSLPDVPPMSYDVTPTPEKKPTPTADPIVPIRPAQVGTIDKDKAREFAYEIVNNVPELGGIPKGFKAGFWFYTLNPDGSQTDIPESNISFSVEGGGVVHEGIAQGTNIKIKIPISRLEDLSKDFCPTVKDMMMSGEANVDISSLGAMQTISLISSAMPIRQRCNIQ